MRLWSIHPEYLDTKGLVALWREALLAKNVLEGNTIGYKNHPQLDRFKRSENPVAYINKYLEYVYYEAVERGYNFNKDKVSWHSGNLKMNVTEGQLAYEKLHLLNKLRIRDPAKFDVLNNITELLPHPLFKSVPGKTECWEII